MKTDSGFILFTLVLAYMVRDLSKMTTQFLCYNTFFYDLYAVGNIVPFRINERTSNFGGKKVFT